MQANFLIEREQPSVDEEEKVQLWKKCTGGSMMPPERMVLGDEANMAACSSSFSEVRIKGSLKVSGWNFSQLSLFLPTDQKLASENDFNLFLSNFPENDFNFSFYRSFSYLSRLVYIYLISNFMDSTNPPGCLIAIPTKSVPAFVCLSIVDLFKWIAAH